MLSSRRVCLFFFTGFEDWIHGYIEVRLIVTFRGQSILVERAPIILAVQLERAFLNDTVDPQKRSAE